MPPLCKLKKVSLYHADIYKVSCMRHDTWDDALKSPTPEYAILDSDDIVKGSDLWRSFLKALKKACSSKWGSKGDPAGYRSDEDPEVSEDPLPASKVRIQSCLLMDVV